MTEPTYTREDMARAWADGYEDGIAYGWGCAMLDGRVPRIDNPYCEQEEA